ncbi:HTTM domain-containing protein [Fervidibacillus albus]|uniref:HTTM domain-containing protein n=1 Tax=Fervidibacillus albus TaxID=2980026 RepID=A0A9E8LSM7_9BACI|nr:HTTM domain-containing protein [Fervidibacillus albus]WAA08796.1 HTTM domain-containing protein [Fervidibacillus albus]
MKKFLHLGRMTIFERGITKMKNNKLNNLYDKLTVYNHLIGASILRILFGIIILYNYIINYSMRHFLWYDTGIISDEIYNSTNKVFFSFYGLNSSLLYFELLYHFSIFIAFLFTIGFGGKIIHLLNYMLFLSLISRNPLITDGGDNILVLCLLYMIFMNTTEHFSIKFKLNKVIRIPQIPNKVKAIIHNYSIIFVVLQICVMYFLSAIFQVMGEKWNNGTALYYILQVDTFSKPFWEDILTSNIFFIVMITYMSIIIKLAFPFLLINKFTKYIAVTMMVGFHLGIALAMGLITFSATMIAIESILFSDYEYKKVYNFIKKRKLYQKFFKQSLKNKQMEVNTLQKEWM